MKRFALFLVLIGVVDQVDNGLALVEWENSTSSYMDIDTFPAPLVEGSTIHLTLTPPHSTNIVLEVSTVGSPPLLLPSEPGTKSTGN
jgi:hypothetical protein